MLFRSVSQSRYWVHKKRIAFVNKVSTRGKNAGQIRQVKGDKYEQRVKSIAIAISKSISDGKVGFPEVQKVIENLTNEGGMFYNLMEEQSKTLTGKISNLGDAIDNMYNSIAAGNDSLIGDGIDGLADLVRNYETVLKILESMVVAYGAYKTAVIINSLTMKGLTMAENLHLIALIAKEKAMKIATATMAMFNKTAMANPLGFVS